MNQRNRVELVAFALWANRKCTTEYGVELDHWEKMHKTAKANWRAQAALKLREWAESAKEQKA